ncbi:MAG: TlpA family protein disulfide reductase [Steroidobacteraceae bacterium]|nr:TlpA family protein disulfide reductase [Steroidobacteraceae bacterium]MBM2853336.1 TlpA family protein disulfide reductase [Steroidobacteraceae bacterium]
MSRHWLALFAMACLAACGRGEAPASADAAPLGQYRAVLSVAGGDLPFGLELTRENGVLVAWLINGPERVRVPDVQLDGDRLTMHMPGYPHRLEARFVDARFEGAVELLRPRGVIKSIRVVAMPGQAWRFFPKPDAEPMDFSGRWALTFRDEEGTESAAIAELTQAGHVVTGTVLRASGDDRYIAGEARGDTLFLSRFDGGSAYLYLGRLGPDGTLAGDFHSGGGAHETWSGRRDPEARLEDPAQMTALKPGASSLEFTFPDLGGSPITFPGAQFAGKVVLITIGGSWCPNCHDEAVFLRELLASRRAQGIEVIQLMFEHTPDFASAAASARAFAEKFSIDYPVLIAGTTSDNDVLKKLPQLQAFGAYPTLFVFDRKGSLRRTHAGFSGPATGAHYQELNRELTAFVDLLLKEPG